MKNKLRDIIAYFCAKYPHPDELSKARMTKMVYLADWKSCIEEGRQLTEIKWYFNHYGPYVTDVVDEAFSSSDLGIYRTTNIFGKPKHIIKLEKNITIDFSEKEKKILDHVINSTEDKNWDQFINLVYSTHPILNLDKYSELDLVALAKEYNELLES